MKHLFKVSLAETSYPHYKRAWDLLCQFYAIWDGSVPKLPLDEHNSALFITYLSLLDYAPGTIHSYVSALSHINRLKKGDGLAESHRCKKLLDGIDKSGPPPRALSPITKDLLHKLITSIDFLLHVPYMSLLYKALYVSMFYMCTRVGEVAASHGTTKNVLQLADLELVTNGKSRPYFLVHFSRFKHNKLSQTHSIPVRPTQGPFCPVRLLQNYLRARGASPGPLFRLESGRHLHATQLSATLTKSLSWARMETSTFGTHSFRIGRCTELAKEGASQTYMKFMGRWHSYAFLKYVRPVVFGS